MIEKFNPSAGEVEKEKQYNALLQRGLYNLTRDELIWIIEYRQDEYENLRGQYLEDVER